MPTSINTKLNPNRAKQDPSNDSVSHSQKTVDQIYKFVDNLVETFNSDLERLQYEDISNYLQEKKRITDTLSKLVSIIAQLDKIKNTEQSEDNNSITMDDQEIIERFFKHYKSNNL